MIKAIFFDIDGTLVSYKTETVPDSTVSAFKALKEKGILCIACTGRHITEIRDLDLKDLEFDAMITLNGQYCYNSQEVYYTNPIDLNDINTLLKEIESNPIPVMFVEDDSMYISYIDESVKEVQAYIHTPLPDIGDLNRGYTHPIYQIIPYHIDETKEKKLLEIMPHVKSTRWHPFAIDMIPKEGGKSIGIEKTLDYYHINIDETAAFGDGENDKDMIEYCHLGIAMGNSCKALKEIADDITDDCDHDGIYNALKKHGIL